MKKEKVNNKAIKEKKKEMSKDKTVELAGDDDNSLIKNLKTNYWKASVCAGIFCLLVYFQILHSKSSRYDSVSYSDVDYRDILGVVNYFNLTTINKKFRELSNIW